jgi:hypothetical protein
MKLVSMKAGLAVLALAGAAVLPAYAQTNASATLTLVRYELVDLDLTDCVTPWLSFQGPGVWSQANIYPGSSSDDHPLEQSTQWSGGIAELQRGSYSARAQAEQTGLHSSVSGGPNLVSSITLMHHTFLLSPNTGVNFFFYTDLDTAAGGGANLAAVGAKVSLGSESSPVTVRAVRDGDGYSGYLSASADFHGVDAVQGTLWMQTYTESYAAAMPVPEPAAPAMLVGGLALLAFGRRRVR